MFKKLLLLSIIILICLAQHSMKVGGYRSVQPDELLQMRNQDEFKIVVNTAKKAFQEKYHKNLGNIINLQTQVVAGINYKIVFQSQQNPIEIVVWAQSWLQSYKITSIRQIKDSL